MVSISVVDDSDTDMTMSPIDSFDTDNMLVDYDPTTDAFSEASDGAAMMDVDDENIGFDNVDDYYDDLDNDTSSDITSFAENEYSYDEIAYMELEGAAEPEPDFIRDTFYGRANTWRLASRKCKLRVALNENRELYRAYLRSLAGWYQVLRRDALNLINLHALLAYESNGEIPMPELDN
ncbi:hypothetical protein BDB00DRAFT_873003 [Zychaea mexicana]|uniref:uncharacterized protein n=1 Tax=Zychaea mexicana TaxID=64656 RepID=UPI0022FEBB39|nr:uncharacterized protein BDB00DRAFT_873003 [Zychaea mexicana]KAI9492781.1 hypothetical protein BDB00DRAFT_873003 [Zychaea mexicana]